jgi:hypothetical protein
MFFYPWYPALMLAVESNNVIDIRLRSIATGKVNAREETRLMVNEKVEAALEASSMVVNGSRPTLAGGLETTSCVPCGRPSSVHRMAC